MARENTVSRLNVIIATVFVVSMLSVPIWQTASDLSSYRQAGIDAPPRVARIFNIPAIAWQRAQQEPEFFPRLWQFNEELRLNLEAHEEDMASTSPMGSFANPFIDQFLTSVLQQGTDIALIGEDGWLYFKEDVEYITSRSFYPPAQEQARGENITSLAAIVHFNHQLNKRGIKLILLLTPVKPCIQPDKLVDGPPVKTPVQNTGFRPFVAALQKNNIAYIDAADVLAKLPTSRPPFLKTDSHWTPTAMRQVAVHTANVVRSQVSWAASHAAPFTVKQHQVTHAGDIAAHLNQHNLDRGKFGTEMVTIEQVRDINGVLVNRSSHRNGPVLLLGDSFSNIYSYAPLGWGESAGLAEHLCMELEVPVDAIIQNGGGANSVRKALIARLEEQPSALEEVRVVIWQFAVRELTSKQWQLLTLPNQQE